MRAHSHCAHPKFHRTNRQYVVRARISHFKQDSRPPFMGHSVSRAYRASLQLQVIQRP